MYALDANLMLVAMVQSMLAKLLTTFLKEIYGQLNKTKSVSWDIDMSNLLFVPIFFMKSFTNFNALINFLSK